MNRRAFTLIELLVVIAIIGMLTTVAVVATSSTRIKARNAQRAADLVQVSKALELYYSDHGGYPNTSSAREGNCISAGSYPDQDPGSWIPGLTSGGYISSLPHDPNTGKVSGSDTVCQASANNTCYKYMSDGIDYKLYAFCLPEGTLSASDPLSDPARAPQAWAVYTPGARAW